MLQRQVRRIENNAACDTVELHQRPQSGELIFGRDEHRPALKLVTPAVEHASREQLAPRDGLVPSEDEAVGQIAQATELVNSDT